MPNTREKLIELMKDGWSLARHYRYAKEEALADYLISNGVTIQDDHHWATEQAYKNGYADGQPKWISVKERLPEYDDEVLCFRGEHIGVLIDVYTYKGDDKWEDTYGNWWYGDLEGITHWMPLPEAPKAENADRCVSCGEIIPEGRQVCHNFERRVKDA